MVIILILSMASPHSLRNFILRESSKGEERERKTETSWKRNEVEKVNHAWKLQRILNTTGTPQCSETKTIFSECAGVSHVAVVSLKQQFSVCVQQVHYPQILVHHSYYYLQRLKDT